MTPLDEMSQMKMSQENCSSRISLSPNSLDQHTAFSATEINFGQDFERKGKDWYRSQNIIINDR